MRSKHRRSGQGFHVLQPDHHDTRSPPGLSIQRGIRMHCCLTPKHSQRSAHSFRAHLQLCRSVLSAQTRPLLISNAQPLQATGRCEGCGCDAQRAWRPLAPPTCNRILMYRSLLDSRTWSAAVTKVKAFPDCSEVSYSSFVGGMCT